MPAINLIESKNHGLLIILSYIKSNGELVKGLLKMA